MDDVNAIYDAFGLDAPEPEPTVDPEDTAGGATEDPAATQDPDETGAPPDGGANAGDNPEDDPAGEADPVEDPPVPTQDNAANAAARRRAEREQEIARVRAEERAESQRRTDEIIAAAFGDKVNPYTGQPIRTQRDYEEYRRYYDDASPSAKDKAPQQALAGDIDESAINEMIAKNPIVQKAHKVVESVEAERVRQRMEAIERAALEDVQKISAFDPSVTDFDSLFQSARGDAIRERVNTGKYTLYEAWQLENLDVIVEAKAAAAAQAAAKNKQSKEHLQATQSKAAPALEAVPSDMREYYAAMGITSEKEQLKAYNKYLKDVSKG